MGPWAGRRSKCRRRSWSAGCSSCGPDSLPPVDDLIYIARGRFSVTAIHPNDRWSVTSSTRFSTQRSSRIQLIIHGTSTAVISVHLTQSYAPCLVDELTKPAHVGRAAGAARVAFVGGDVADGELEVRIAEGRERFQGVVERLPGDLFSKVRQGLDVLDQGAVLGGHEPAHVGQMVGQHRGPVRDFQKGHDGRYHAALSPRLAAKVQGAVSTPS